MKRAFDKIADVAAIREALVEGEQSGEPEAFDFAAFKQRKAMQQSETLDGGRRGIGGLI